jgi:hypothetical protein
MLIEVRCALQGICRCVMFNYWKEYIGIVTDVGRFMGYKTHCLSCLSGCAQGGGPHQAKEYLG